MPDEIRYDSADAAPDRGAGSAPGDTPLGWDVGPAPAYGPEPEGRAAPEAPTRSDIMGTPEIRETAADVIEHIVHDEYAEQMPAIEVAAEADLLANALPELTEEGTLREPPVPLGSTEPVEEENAGSAPVGEPGRRLAAWETDLAAFNRKIAQYPEAPSNYVLRGELYLSLGDYARARSDFQTAIHLADALDPDLDWGYINSALIDRAYENLRQLQS